jgi:hypothetical protein
MTEETFAKAEEYLELLFENYPELPDAVGQLEILSLGRNTFFEFEIIKTMAVMLNDRMVHHISETENPEESKTIASFIFRMGRVFERINRQMEMISGLN